MHELSWYWDRKKIYFVPLRSGDANSIVQPTKQYVLYGNKTHVLLV